MNRVAKLMYNVSGPPRLKTFVSKSEFVPCLSLLSAPPQLQLVALRKHLSFNGKFQFAVFFDERHRFSHIPSV